MEAIRGPVDRMPARDARPPASTGRALASAAGLGAADGILAGALAGFAVVALAEFLGLLSASAWAGLAGLEVGRVAGWMQSPVVLAVLLPASFVGGRRAVAALEMVGEVDRRRATLLVSALGATLLLILFLVAIPLPVDAVLAAGEIVVVGAWVVGAWSLYRSRPLRLNVRGWLLGGIVLGAGLFVAYGPVGARPPKEMDQHTWFEPNVSRIGPAGPDRISWKVGLNELQGAPAMDVEVTQWRRPPAGWSDLRLELWAAVRKDTTSPFMREQVGDVDPSVAGPLRIVAIPPDAPRHQVIALGEIRGLDTAIASLTAVHDGTRYVLATHPVVAEYRVTLLGWLLSYLPGSPDAVHPVQP